MVWRPAQVGDLGWVEALLRRHVKSSMFLLGNLLNHGLNSCARHGLELWVTKAPQGVFAITNSGMLLMQAPEAAAADWRAAARLPGARRVAGASGDAAQLRSFLRAAGLAGAPARMDEDEPGFRLDLGDLLPPDCSGYQLRPLADAPRGTVTAWRCAYLTEVLGTPESQAESIAADDIGRYLERGSHRMLYEGTRPVAMTGFNAEVPGAVQVGGVYTPPALRGLGHARRAVALHLAEARARGVQQAVLFAASAAAARAYRAIGFQPAGAYGLVLFEPAQTLCAAAQLQEKS